MHARVFSVLFAIATLAQRPCAAQTPAAAPAKTHPEWTGYYRMARGADLAGFKPENQDEQDSAIDRALDAAITPKLQPWARLKLAQTYGTAEDTGAICQLDGLFRIPVRGGGFMWLPAGNKIILVSSNIYSGGIRNVYLDRPHPKYPTPSWMGDSVGHWEDDTLVVDTIGFNDKTWLTSSMQPHTEELHVVERFRMAAKNLLEWRVTVDDRQALIAPYTFSRYYKLAAPEVRESICNPEPGDQRMWSEFRYQARKHSMLPVAEQAAPAAPGKATVPGKTDLEKKDTGKRDLGKEDLGKTEERPE
jgi:hypothetical protein